MRELRVLLVDDEEEFTAALAERLGLRGISASSSSSGLEALKMIEANPPDVVVLDLMMPGISGMEIFTRIRSSHPEIGVIFLTGQLSSKTGRPFPGLDLCDCLVKPVDIEELILRIRTAVVAGRT